VGEVGGCWVVGFFLLVGGWLVQVVGLWLGVLGWVWVWVLNRSGWVVRVVRQA